MRFYFAVVVSVLLLVSACGNDEEPMPINQDVQSSSSITGDISSSSSANSIAVYSSSSLPQVPVTIQQSSHQELSRENPLVPDRTTMMVQEYDNEGSIIADTGNAYGTVRTSWKRGTFSLLATVINLEGPPPGKRYIGWLVWVDPPAYKKTGALEQVYGSFVNTYTTEEDLRAFAHYGVTLDDPTAEVPGERILRATLQEE